MTQTVLHLIETRETGGAENMLIRLIDHLPTDRYRSIVGLPGDGWLNRQFLARGIETVLFPLERSVDLAWIRHARRLIRTRRVALIHAHEFAMNSYGALMSYLTGVPGIATVHGRGYYAARLRRRLVYRFVARRSTMVAVSEDIRRLLIGTVGVRPDRVRTIWNGVELDRFRLDPERAAQLREQVRAEWGVGPDQPVVGTVGNLDPVKGHAYLIDAAAPVCRAYPTAMFVIAGHGQLHDDLARQAADLGLADRVHLLGFREDVPALLQAIDVFALPSLSEGLPLAVIEAMAAGRPVVATAVGGTCEVLRDDDTGLLVPPGDPAALAAGIGRLLAQADTRTRLTANAARQVAREFDMATTMKRYLELYDRLTGAAEGGPARPAEAPRRQPLEPG